MVHGLCSSHIPWVESWSATDQYLPSNHDGLFPLVALVLAEQLALFESVALVCDAWGYCFCRRLTDKVNPPIELHPRAPLEVLQRPA